MLSTITLLVAAAASVSAQDGVFNSGPIGKENPPPTMGTAINQASVSRIVSLNSIDDFCILGPMGTGQPIGNIEGEVVAYCTKARNGARILPDGIITGLSFLKTDSYVQLMGYGDFTKIGIPDGDYGGELDPHGAEGLGNPVGGDVVVNVGGQDKYIKEWMMYMSYNAFCFRACTSENSTYPAARMCEHKLDVMGCQFVMPGNYDFNGRFETCDADTAYPPGWYPKGDGTFSKFEQYWTGVVGDKTWTVGDLVTPAAPASVPKSSNCVATSTVGNGIPVSLLTAGAVGPVPTNEAATKAGAGVTANPANTVKASNSVNAADTTAAPAKPTGGAGGAGTSAGANNKPSGSRNTTGDAQNSTGSSGAASLGAPLATVFVALLAAFSLTL